MRSILSALAIFLLAACASGTRERDRPFRDIPQVANPSAVVAAEIAFAQLARDKGQWTAFRETATPDARMFVPELVMAQPWLKNRVDPPRAVAWQPHRIIMACDGSLAASTGAWQRADGSTGYFTTIWQRQPQKPGKPVEYKWVFDHGAPLEKPLAAPDFVETRVAACKPSASGDERIIVGTTVANHSAQSSDRTLFWNASGLGDKSAVLQVSLWNGTEYEPLIIDKVAAPAP